MKKAEKFTTQWHCFSPISSVTVSKPFLKSLDKLLICSCFLIGCKRDTIFWVSLSSLAATISFFCQHLVRHPHFPEIYIMMMKCCFLFHFLEPSRELRNNWISLSMSKKNNLWWLQTKIWIKLSSEGVAQISFPLFIVRKRSSLQTNFGNFMSYRNFTANSLLP